MACLYCGSSNPPGGSCSYSPTSKHIALNAGKCSFCGTTNPPGGSCSYSPTGKHVHGVGTVQIFFERQDSVNFFHLYQAYVLH